MNNMEIIYNMKDRIKLFEEKENNKREKFSEDIFGILNTELNKLNKIDIMKSNESFQ